MGMGACSGGCGGDGMYNTEESVMGDALFSGFVTLLGILAVAVMGYLVIEVIRVIVRDFHDTE